MSQAIAIPECTMLAATLQRLLADGSLTVSAVSNATEIDGSSVYRWAAGQHEPGFSKIALLFRHCGSERVQRELLDLLTRGTPWLAVRLPGDGDVNGDGDVDTDDALASAIDATKAIGQLLDGVHTADDDRVVTPHERDMVRDTANAAIRAILTAVQCVDFVCDQRINAGRRKAKSVAT